MQKPRLVVLTGAGISAESGLKTFRDSDGLWEGYKVEEVATPEAWYQNPKRVLDFYNMRRRNVLDAQPNAAHIGLAHLEKEFEVTIITQNIDDLHERGGSTKIIHLHGEIFKMRSETNENIQSEIKGDIQLGECAPDGGQWRPHIVWFGEPVYAIEESIPVVRSADIFAVIGTSLVVYPAAGLLNYAHYHIPKFIVDRVIPYTGAVPNLVAIEKPATEGISELKEKLLDLKKEWLAG